MSVRNLRLILPFTLCLIPGLARAQAAADTQKSSLTINGSIRTRVEAWEWFEGNANNSYAFSGSIFRLSLGQQTKDWDWQFEMAAPLLLGLPDDAVAPGTQGQLGLGATYYVANDYSRNAGLPFLKQGFFRLKHLGGSEASSLRIGRTEFIDATEVIPKSATLAAVKRERLGHKLIGNFVWSHVGRSFDGLTYVYNTSRNNFTFLGARPTRGVFQVDGWGELNVGLSYASYTRQVGSEKSSGDLRLFAIFYDDWRKNIVKTDNRPLAIRRADQGNIRIGTTGGHYIHAFETPSGTFDLLLWGAAQFGSWGVQDHRAGAIAAEAGYQPPIWHKLKPWVRGGFSYSSGDGNPTDNTHSTFFQILPTPRWLARFPFYNLMNNQDAFGEVILRPHARFNIRSEIHSLRLANGNDFWYQGGGAYQPWTFGYTGRPSGGKRDMATVADISADYQINRKVSINVYFANAWGGQVMQSIYPNGKDARLGYVELGYRF